MRDAAESQVSAVELFLNSVPILNPLSREEKLRLVDAFEQQTYTPGTEVRGPAGLCGWWGHGVPCGPGKWRDLKQQ